MDSIVFYIEGEQVDIWSAKELGLAATYQVTDVNKIDSRKTYSTKTIKLPTTKRNRRLLGFPDDLNSSLAVSQSQTLSASVVKNGETVVIGRLRFMGTEINKGKSFYKIVIFGGGDWKLDLENKRLKDLDLKDQAHLWSFENIEAENPDPERAYIYPLVDAGGIGQIPIIDVTPFSSIPALKFRSSTVAPSNLFAPFPLVSGAELTLIGFDDSTLNRTVDLTQSFPNYHGEGYEAAAIYDPELVGFNANGLKSGFAILNPQDPNRRDVKINDRFPAWNVGYLVRKIYDGIGYKVVSNHLLDKMNNCYLLFRGGEHKLPEKYKVENSEYITGADIVTNSNPSQEGIIIPLFDTPIMESESYNPLNGEYTAETPSKRVLYARIIVSSTALCSFSVRIKFRDKNGNIRNIASKLFAGSGITPRTVNVSTVEKVTFERGEAAWVECEFSFLAPSESITIHEESFLKIDLEEGYPEAGSAIIPENWLPDENQLTLIQGIKHAFNLMFIPNPDEKTIFIEPRDKFYTDKKIDWTGKVDTSKKIEIKEIASSLNRFIRYSYKKDGNDAFVNEWIEPQLGKPLHSRKVERANQFAKDDITEVQNPLFSPTYMAAPENLGLSVPIPRIWNVKTNKEPQEKTFFAPRLLYFEGNVPLPSGESWTFEGRNKTSYPKVYSVDEQNYNYNGLSFDDQEKSVGLYTKHYASQQKEIDQARLFKAFLNLSPKDISLFANIAEEPKGDFRNVFYLNYNHEIHYFRVAKIVDYIPSNNSTTRVEFVTKIDPPLLPKFPIAVLECSDAIVNNTTENANIQAQITVTNTGGVSGSCSLDFEVPSIPSLSVQTFNFSLNSGQSQTVSASWVAPIGSAGTHTVQIRGCCNVDLEFEVGQCQTPANLQYNQDAEINPEELQQGDDASLTFSLSNSGCLSGSVSGSVDIVGTVSGIVYQTHSYSATVGGLSTSVISILLENLPVGEGLAETLEAQITGDVTDNILFFVLANNPLSVPQLISTTPADDGTSVPPTTDIELEFNKSMQFGASGQELRIIDSTNGGTFATYTSASPEVSIAGAVVTVNPSSNLPANTDFYIEVDSDFVQSTAAVSYGGFVDPNFLNFQTGSAGTQTQDVYNTNTGTNAHGRIFGADVTWADVVSKTNGNSWSATSQDVQIQVGQNTTPQPYFIERGFLYFDTSFITPAATVTLCEIHLFVENFGDGALVAQKGTQSSSLTSQDFDAFTGTELGRVAPTLGAYNVISVPVSTVNKGGWTKIAIRHEKDFDNVAPLGAIHATELELRTAGKEPFLRISYQ